MIWIGVFFETAIYSKPDYFNVMYYHGILNIWGNFGLCNEKNTPVHGTSSVLWYTCDHFARLHMFSFVKIDYQIIRQEKEASETIV